MNALAPTVLPLDSAHASLDLVGGKGHTLAKLAAAGQPLPAGFLVSTSAYRKFVELHDLQQTILETVNGIAPHDAASLELAAASVQSRFADAAIPPDVAEAVLQAYDALGEGQPAVAVRSSATAEDLPGSSFAGQHDSSLNVHGHAALLAAIRRCWASLWTARAIGYRERMHVDSRVMAMGVVVQRMVRADVSGIAFTANPSDGNRSELVINASFGLGEAIVGGHVTPDTYVVNRANRQLKATVVGAKREMIVLGNEQGTVVEPVPEGKRNEPALAAEIVRELASLCLQVEELLDGCPQDIEWAEAGGKCWLLQARPITNLPAPPLQDVSWDPPTPGARLIRRQVVENMPDPLSPLFEELYLQEGLEKSTDQFLANFNIPFNLDDIIQRPMFLTVNGYAYCRCDYRSTWRLLRVLPRVLFWYCFALPKLLRNVIPQWRDEGLPAYLAVIARWKAVEPATASDEQLLAGVRDLTTADAICWFHVAIVLGAAKVTDGLLNRFLTSWLVGGNLTSGVFLRGFPSKTLQAQEDLEAIARRIRSTSSLHHLVLTTPAGNLLETFHRQPDCDSLREEIHQYLVEYGHQIYNLDFVQPTQAEDPLPVLLTLKTLVQHPEYDTHARHAEMAQERESRVAKTLATLGPLRRWMFRKLLGWAQNYGPHREQALFYMGAAWPTLRGLALELGERLVAAGTLQTPAAVFYLQSPELVEACTARQKGRAIPTLGLTADSRRELREARGKLHPPGMVPEGSRFRFGPFDLSIFETQKRNEVDSDTLQGFAVSPGQVTGPATVILTSKDFARMQPDTILVCPTTTPAWTPLFVQALGLVTDIGGILAHGSIVAREYGIPAVMGTGNATQRIVTGQQITVDGNTGMVTILD